MANNVVSLLIGELLRFFGIFMLIATTTGWNCDDFWAADIPDPRNPCPYNFLDYMSKRRFNAILRELRLIDRERPPFLNKSWEVRQMVAEWNANMALQFIVGWIVFLDESMSIWTNRWTCPGWVF